MSIWDNIQKLAIEETINKMLPTGVEEFRVVGVTFTPNYPGSILALDKIEGEISLTLVRNPYNKFDSNAVEVRYAHEMLGHLAKEVAARVAPKLDAGQSYTARVDRVLINPDKPDLPGLDIIVEWKS